MRDRSTCDQFELQAQTGTWKEWSKTLAPSPTQTPNPEILHSFAQNFVIRALIGWMMPQEELVWGIWPQPVPGCTPLTPWRPTRCGSLKTMAMRSKSQPRLAKVRWNMGPCQHETWAAALQKLEAGIGCRQGFWTGRFDLLVFKEII